MLLGKEKLDVQFWLWASVLLLVSVTPGASWAGDLVGHWRLDEGTGDIASDSSGNGNAGTVYGASWVPGQVGNALSFDGIDDYVEVAYSPELGLTNGIAIEAWVRRAAEGTLLPIVSKGTGPNGTINYEFFINSDGVPRFCFWTGSWHQFDAADAIDLQWHKVGVTYNGSAVQFSIDDTPGTPSPETALMVDNGEPLYIGRKMSSNPFTYASGLIDEVRVYTPEPATLSLMALGGLAVLWRKRR